MSTKLIDTHCHPHFSKYDSDREEIILRAQNAGVGMIGVGVDLDSSKKEIEIAEKYGHYASVGLHPNDNLDEEYDETEYAKLAVHPRVVAIGEIGLDYYRTTDDAKKRFQKERFLQQLDLAERLDKPVIIHCRDGSTSSPQSAHADMIQILETRNLKPETNLSGVIHSFTGTYADAKKYIEMGFYIGLNGIITFSRDYDETVKNIPLESILLETDAPFLAPEKYRGKRNEPAYIIEVAQKLAELRGKTLVKVMEVTLNNTRKLFNLD